MRKRILLILSLVVLFMAKTEGQSRIENRNNFFEAESWVLYEDFEEALPLYLRLAMIYPNNFNYKYRIGQCYINIPGEKNNAISYLEVASRNINPKYKEGKFKETGAPFDTYYHLANAYRINNDIDMALETYQFFKDNMDNNIYDSAIINREIQSCINARDLMDSPMYVRYDNLGENINDENSDSYPVINNDETMLIYSKSLAFYDAILYSTKVGEEWSNPLNLNEMLMVDNDLYPTSISNDGTTLYLYSTTNYDGIIYESKLIDNIWTPIIPLNEHINTKYWESHAAISHDGNKLFFTSNRKGTYGGLDIYMSTIDSLTGDWGPAVNLGPTINTIYNEESPFLSEDDKILFFSSRGHHNIGGYDIFYSTLMDNGEWSVPLNSGYPMNTTDDDLFFLPMNDGYEGYYAKEIDNGFGAKDLFRIEIFSEDHPRKFSISGKVRVGNQFSLYNDSVKITAIKITDLNNPEKVVEVYSDPETGEYQIDLPQGEYEIIFESDNGQTVRKEMTLALDEPEDLRKIEDVLVPLTDFIAYLQVNTAREISVEDGDTISIPLSVEPNSVLEIRQYVGDNLIVSEIFLINDSIFTYKYLPPVGNSRIELKATDKYGNNTSTDITITRKDIPVPVENPDYTNIVSKRQINDITEMQKVYADEATIVIIEESTVKEENFATIDEQIDFLKQVAEERGAESEEIKELALKVSMNDNILSQTSVDLLEEYAGGDLKNILQGIDIYEQDLKSWDDLIGYIYEESSSEIGIEEVEQLANGIFDNNALTETLKNNILSQPAITQLYKGAGGELKTILADTDIEELGLHNWNDLVSHIEQQSEGRINGEAVREVAEKIISKQAVENAYENNTLSQEALEMLGRYATGELKDILSGIDMADSGLATYDDLVTYLRSESQGRISKEEVDALSERVLKKSDLIDALQKETIDQSAVDILGKYNDDLAEVLMDLDMRQEEIENWDDLMDYIRSRSNGLITNKEVNIIADNITGNDALRNSMETGIVTRDAVDQLKRYVEGELIDILESVDFEKSEPTWEEFIHKIDSLTNDTVTSSGIRTIAEDIVGHQALRKSVEENRLSQDAVDFLERFVSGELKRILGETEIDSMALETWDDLVNYIQELSSGTITESYIDTQVNNVLEKEDLLRAMSHNELSQGAIDILELYADGELKDILHNLEIDEQKFESYNDLIRFIEEKSEGRVTSDMVNSLSNSIRDDIHLLDAVRNNKISVEAIETLNRYASDELKEIIRGIDVESLKLESWDDFLEYIEERSSGGFTVDQINGLTISILNTLPDIDKLMYKVIAFGSSNEHNAIFMETMEKIASKEITSTDEWLITFYNEAIDLGVSNNEITTMLVSLTSQPGEDEDEYLQYLIELSGDNLSIWLKSIDMEQESIHNVEDLVSFILDNRIDHGINDEELFKAFSTLIREKDISPYLIEANIKGKQKNGDLWILWMLLAIGGALFWYIKKEDLI